MKNLFWLVLVMLGVTFTVGNSSCDNEQDWTKNHSDTIIIPTGVQVITALDHSVDSSEIVKYVDDMTSHLTIYDVENGVRVEPARFNDAIELPLTMVGSLAKHDYAIVEPVLYNLAPTAFEILRGIDKDSNEVDTIVSHYACGQIATSVLTIKNASAGVKNTTYKYPSMTLKSARVAYHHRTPKTKTRGTYRSQDFNDEFRIEATLVETEVENPKTMVAAITLATTTYLLAEDEFDYEILVDTVRTRIDDKSEELKVITDKHYKSGIVMGSEYSFIQPFEFNGKDPYDKVVGSFAYNHTGRTPIAWESEYARQTNDTLWSSYSKRGSSTEINENGIAADKATTGYEYMISRAIFDNGKIRVDFGYAPVKVDLLQASVTAVDSDKDGYKKAVLKNFITVDYLGGNQTLSGEVNLYMSNTDVKDEILEGKEYVKNDSTCADMTYKRILENGKEVITNDHWSAPWIITNESDWTTTQEVLSQVTDKDVVVTLMGSSTKTKGNWTWTEKIFSLVDKAHMYDGQVMSNIRKVIYADELVYKTESGKVYRFDALPYSVKEIGAALNMKTKDVYDYNEVIEETLGGYTRSNTAHGTLNITEEKILKIEGRNLVQTVYDNRVHNEFDLVTITSKNENVEHKSHDFPCTDEVRSNWTVTANDASEKTQQPSVTMTGSEVVTDDNWSCDMQTYVTKSSVDFNGAMTQYNELVSKRPNHVKYVNNGFVVEFPELKFNAALVNTAVTPWSKEGLTQTSKYTGSYSLSYGENMKTLAAPGTVVVTENDDIVDYDVRDKHYVITNNDVTAVGQLISIHKSGKEDEEVISKSVPRVARIYPFWHVSDENASVLTNSAVVKLLSNVPQTDGNWGYNMVKRANTTIAQLQNSNQTNGVETEDPNNFTYKINGKVYEWGEISFSAEEKGDNVTVNSDTSTQTSYDYKDNVEIVYGDNHQTFELSGVIDVAKEKTITNVTVKYSQTLGENGVDNVVNIICDWTDGSQTQKTISQFFDGNLSRLPGWTSNENNANQSTSSASISLISSNEKTENDGDGVWTCYEETERITTEAALDGSTQTNVWEARYPKKVTYEDKKNGIYVDFGTLNLSAKMVGAEVTKVKEDSEGSEYDYSVNIDLTYGNSDASANFSSDNTGKIFVKAPWDPDFDHGKFTSCAITTARDETRKTWVYVVSVGFETGHLPLIIRRDASAPEVNEAYFEADTDSRLNSGTWVPSFGKWINTIASDTADLMQWSTTDGGNAENMAYPTATAWGWDYGYTVKGHPSVTTDKFSASISSDGYVLTIYKGGDVFATYKAAKH